MYKLRIIFWSCQLIFFYLKISLAVPVNNPIAVNNNNKSNPDFSSSFAKQILRLSRTAEISSLLNTKANPCEDFYTYACGNWHRSNPAQLFTSIMTDRFQMIAQVFDRRLKRFLNLPRSGNDLEDKVRDFYQACSVVKSNKIQYSLALENLYKEFGSLPALIGDQWNETATDFNWWKTAAKIQHKYGHQILFAVDVFEDIRNSDQNRIYLGPPEFTATSSTKILNILQEVSASMRMEEVLGVEHSVAKQTAKDIFLFEQKLIRGASNARSGLGLNDLLTLRKVDELQMLYASQNFDLRKYLQIVLGTEPPNEIYVYDEDYIDSSIQTLHEASERTIANYIIWQLLQEYMIEADEDDLLSWCIDKTKKYFGKFVDHMIYESYRSDKAEQEVYDVWTQIRDTFRKNLLGDKLDWISNSTRTYAIEKLDTMKLAINSYDNENFTEHYGELEIDRLNYVKNVQQILMRESSNKFSKLNSTAASIDATEVLSFTPAYNILENNIKIPVAFLQPRFFWDDTSPEVLKFATLGTLIAHEMVHGFDDDGHKLDKNGKTHNWWDAKSQYEFDERRKCFQAQYHSYKYGGTQLPESVSQSENIADNAGVKIAYASYINWLNSQKKEKPDIEELEALPGLAFNNRQLFFLSFAQMWCDDVQTLFKSSVASEDMHAPGKYRVIGPLSNFQEFSWVFECKQDAPMDPEYKCSIY
ncbi:neprilysin-4 [Teleopsis dalmanni]|uniref:neprilysin-4 n=1 Tax=Teleopsis dalmanni TaxID=139649 RepID=UPI0018CDAA61|nr:neprilysin-4 [Teleopsis dalmanni]